jgi:hypothetical protein
MVNTLKELGLLIFITVFLTSAAACGKNEQEEGPAERAGKQLDEATKQIGQEAGKMLEQAGEAMKETGEKMQKESGQ